MFKSDKVRFGVSLVLILILILAIFTIYIYLDKFSMYEFAYNSNIFQIYRRALQSVRRDLERPGNPATTRFKINSAKYIGIRVESQDRK